jgi:xylulose-5-phosphate/fructose-6-phosphate phosphoketolase
VPLPAAKTDKAELADLQGWLESYDIQSLIDPKTGNIDKSILELIPKDAVKRLGRRKEVYAGYEPLEVPSWIETGLGVKAGKQESCMKVVGEFLLKVMEK